MTMNPHEYGYFAALKLLSRLTRTFKYFEKANKKLGQRN